MHNYLLWLQRVFVVFLASLPCCDFASAQLPPRNIELLSNLPIDAIGGGGRGNDIWGWTDPTTGREYALMGRRNGTSFVDVTEPRNPQYLGNMPTRTGESTWRDIKVYNDHAYVVSDNNGPHGVQIFDLKRLRNVTTPQTFSPNRVHDGVRSAHNIAINEQTGYAYVTDGDILDLSNPLFPNRVGTVAPNTHDTMATIYQGPDSNFQGREILFSSNGSSLTIYDVTNKSNPITLSSSTHQGASFIHQGWISDDHQYFYLNDETDSATWTHVYDISDLNQPDHRGSIPWLRRSIDHNLYVKDDLIYAANYTTGVWVLKVNDPATADIVAIANYDTFDFRNGFTFDGAWSVYPWFESGNIIVSDINNGLFVLRVDIEDSDFNGDGLYDCTDVNSLTAAIASGSNDDKFDLNHDGIVDRSDITKWLDAAGAVNLPTGQSFLMGDANLDGVVDAGDFNQWNANKFSQAAHWCAGDFNGDGSVDGSDFNQWNANKFESALVPEAVPEPSAIAYVVTMILAAFGYRRLLSPSCGERRA